jgi:hypothetical protein
MDREIKLSGGEITVLKLLGVSGTPISGKQLIERASALEPAEFLDTLDGLIALGYVFANKVNIRQMEDVEIAYFRVNSAYMRELREAISPGRRREKERTRRRRRA